MSEFAKTFPAITHRVLTVADKGRVVQHRGSFGVVTGAENGLFLVMFRDQCHFVFAPYNGEKVILFDAPVVYVPRLLSYHGDNVPERHSLSLYFDGGDPLVIVDDPEPFNPALYPGKPLRQPAMRFRLFNLITGETLPSDDTARPSYLHWAQEIHYSDGSKTQLILLNEETRGAAVNKQHVMGLRR